METVVALAVQASMDCDALQVGHCRRTTATYQINDACVENLARPTVDTTMDFNVLWIEYTEQRPQDESMTVSSGLLDDNIPTLSVCSPNPTEEGNEETPGPEVLPQEEPSFSGSTMHAGENKEMVITRIRVTDVALGLRRVSAGFYVVVGHSGLVWRSENKSSSVVHDVVEWTEPIPIPLALSATISLGIYASFEFQPMLGDGEQLRQLTITMEQLLDRNTRDVREWAGILPPDLRTDTMTAFALFPKDGDVVSPCSSIQVTIRGRKCESSDLSMSTDLGPHCSNTESQGDLASATNRGHCALSRYQKYGEKQDLEQSIEHFERGLSICSADHPCRAAAQSNLAMARFILCQVEDTDAFFAAPLGLFRHALDARPVGHVDRPCTLNQLAAVHFKRFEKLRDEVESAQAEALLHEVTRLSSAESFEHRAAMFMLQLHVGRRVNPVQQDGPSWVEQDLTARFGEVEQAITVLEECAQSTSGWDHQDNPGLGNFGVTLSDRFKHRDIEDALSTLRGAIDSIPHGDPGKPACLYELGNFFLLRFRHLQEFSDLENAISTLKDAVDLTPHAHPDKPDRLNNLGTSFFTRFERLGDLSDLESAISRQRGAADLIPDGDPHKSGCLNNLGNSFKARFERLGELHDLENAILMLKDAVHLLPHGHPDQPICLGNLGNSFFARFQRLGKHSDLEDAISTQRDAVNLTSNGHPEKPTSLNNLGITLFARFQRLGGLSDLGDAISTFRDAVAFTPRGHPDKPGRLSNLGYSLFTRFRRLGELTDLEDAISLQTDAVVLTPDDHPRKPGCLNNLGFFFEVRFERLGQPKDLEDAILTLKDAAKLTPVGHPDKPTCLNNLATSFLARFQHAGELSDLEDGISILERALDLAPHDYPDKPMYLNNLGTSLRTRFERLGRASDLQEAVSRQRDAIELTPHDHPSKCDRLCSLGDSFVAYFEHLGEPSDLEHAISLYSQASFDYFGPIGDRFYAAQRWISSARRVRHHSLLRAYSVAINLLPQLAWIGLSLTQRYSDLLQRADVVREAAAAALESGFPETAVEWLEQGRSIVWGELLQLRSSYDELSSAHPDYARRLRELSTALEHAGTARESFLSALWEQPPDAARELYAALEHPGAIHEKPGVLQQTRRTKESLEQHVVRHHTLAIERDKLLHEIRQLPGLERFLLQKEFSQLCTSAHAGPVVILNAAETRCDALVLVPNVDHVIHVPLPNFTLKQSAYLQKKMKSFVRFAREGKPAKWDDISWESLLSPLWRCVAKPVLDALAISTPGDVSRIFWCPTGPFAFLPIHAAGFYDSHYSQPGHKVFDFVVSSYVPTLAVLAPSPNTTAVSSGDICLLAVRQPLSDGLSPLPGANSELGHIKAVIRDSPLTCTVLMESSVGTMEEVLALMREADWVHFACHGIQDTVTPIDSGLCLADRRRLKISDIIAVSRPHGGLAFLSACQTAMGEERLSDEAIHIAAGMLFAGYEGVIGTMWSISDWLAPDVARDVYEQLFGNGRRPDYRDAARALHEAIGRVRDNGSVSFDEWISFIHVGL